VAQAGATFARPGGVLSTKLRGSCSRRRGRETLGAAAIADMTWRSVLVAAFLGALGVCIGALVRHQTVAVVGVLIVAVIVDPLLLQGATGIARFEPLLGVPSSITDGTNALGHDQLPPVVAVAIALAWIAATFAAAATLLGRRDLV
jgi:hypothetical protein